MRKLYKLLKNLTLKHVLLNFNFQSFRKLEKIQLPFSLVYPPSDNFIAGVFKFRQLHVWNLSTSVYCIILFDKLHFQFFVQNRGIQISYEMLLGTKVAVVKFDVLVVRRFEMGELLYYVGVAIPTT